MHERLPRTRSATGTNTGSWTPTPETAQRWVSLEASGTATVDSVQHQFVHHATRTLARSAGNMDAFAAYQAAALTVRDDLIGRWNTTQQTLTALAPKRVYYLSLEFLIGRSFDNALLNLALKPLYTAALGSLGFRVEDLVCEEQDAALGNGGLGRLAACFMDSLASLEYPAWGYGIRYTYGIFQQRIQDGFQTEVPDYWLSLGNPWEIERIDVAYDVGFRGSVRSARVNGSLVHVWEPAERVVAIAYDYPIPGFRTTNTNNIRLWSAKPKKEFDFAEFNEGRYESSVQEQHEAENITACLYPNDSHEGGKALRLKQQYFFVCATLQDIIRRFKKSNDQWSEFPNQVAIQLNDTHPTIGIVELQRILVDEEGLAWDAAWKIVTKTYSYTNHTVLPEALEKWSVGLFNELLPRHMAVIFDINLFFLQQVEKAFPGDRERLRRMSIIEEGAQQSVRMAFLAVAGSHCVNGVAALHSELVKTQLFPDFVEFYGHEKFTNVTNGVTSRRWLNQANPELAALITETIGSEDWLKDLTKIKPILLKAKDPEFQAKWMAIKRRNKARLADYILEACGITVSPDALFDIQCKRLHEYKRQFMNILGVIHRYEKLSRMSESDLERVVPHVVIFSGKSAPGYYMAKLVIKLINNVAIVLNADKKTSKYLKLVFIPNYNVSLAEIIVPASDISQHISTAGTEASGTSNMKFVLNGGLIIGTVDGANIEIGEEVGSDNIFLFGTLTAQVEDIRHKQTYQGEMVRNSDLERVVQSIQTGKYGLPGIFEPLLSTLVKDFYLVHTDFGEYLSTIDKVDVAFSDRNSWAEKSITCAAHMAKFSSDRSIREYAERIWGIVPHPVGN